MVSEFIEGSTTNTALGVVGGLSGDVDLIDRFANLATTMTDYERYGPNDQTAYGDLVESVPFVSIRWGISSSRS